MQAPRPVCLEFPYPAQDLAPSRCWEKMCQRVAAFTGCVSLGKSLPPSGPRFSVYPRSGWSRQALRRPPFMPPLLLSSAGRPSIPLHYLCQCRLPSPTSRQPCNLPSLEEATPTVGLISMPVWHTFPQTRTFQERLPPELSEDLGKEMSPSPEVRLRTQWGNTKLSRMQRHQATRVWTEIP